MGTRSTYRIIEEVKDTVVNGIQIYKKEPIVLIYRQYDGYPSGHPLETAEFLSEVNIVNGIGSGAEFGKTVNGIGCLAATLVAQMKDGVGGTYLHSPKQRGLLGEDYCYDIIMHADLSITYKAFDVDNLSKPIFEGSPSEFVQKYEKVEG